MSSWGWIESFRADTPCVILVGESVSFGRDVSNHRGVYVNGKRIPARGKAPLKSGDRLRVLTAEESPEAFEFVYHAEDMLARFGGTNLELVVKPMLAAPMAVIGALSDVIPSLDPSPAAEKETIRKVASVLEGVFVLSDKSQHLLVEGLAASIQGAPTAADNLIVRPTERPTLLSTVIYSSLRAVSRGYVASVFGPFLSHLAQSPNMQTEIDPALVPDQTVQRENMYNLTRAFDWCAARLWTSAITCPAPFREALCHARGIATAKWPTERWSVSRLVIHDAFAPALLSPLAFGLCTQEPLPGVTRTLQLISKMLSTLAVGAEFESTSYMFPLNGALRSNRDVMANFCDSVSSRDAMILTDAPAAPSGTADGSSLPQLVQELAGVFVLAEPAVRTALEARAVPAIDSWLGALRRTYAERAVALRISTPVTADGFSLAAVEIVEGYFLQGLEQRERLTSFSYACPTAAVETAAEALLAVFCRYERVMELLLWAIDAEVAATERFSELFRGLTIATKLLAEFTRIAGVEWLQASFGPVVAELMAHRDSMEVDPSKCTDVQRLRRNMLQLRVYADVTLAQILSAQNGCPPALRFLFAYLRQVVAQRWPEEEIVAVTGFVFLRFLVPALVSPLQFKLVDTRPAEHSARSLMLVGKVLQNLANGREFGQKEAFMRPLNGFVNEHAAEIREYGTAITAPTDTTAEAFSRMYADASGNVVTSCAHLGRQLRDLMPAVVESLMATSASREDRGVRVTALEAVVAAVPSVVRVRSKLPPAQLGKVLPPVALSAMHELLYSGPLAVETLLVAGTAVPQSMAAQATAMQRAIEVLYLEDAAALGYIARHEAATALDPSSFLQGLTAGSRILGDLLKAETKAFCLSYAQAIEQHLLHMGPVAAANVDDSVFVPVIDFAFCKLNMSGSLISERARDVLTAVLGAARDRWSADMAMTLTMGMLMRRTVVPSLMQHVQAKGDKNEMRCMTLLGKVLNAISQGKEPSPTDQLVAFHDIMRTHTTATLNFMSELCKSRAVPPMNTARSAARDSAIRSLVTAVAETLGPMAAVGPPHSTVLIRLCGLIEEPFMPQACAHTIATDELAAVQTMLLVRDDFHVLAPALAASAPPAVHAELADLLLEIFDANGELMILAEWALTSQTPIPLLVTGAMIGDRIAEDASAVAQGFFRELRTAVHSLTFMAAIPAAESIEAMTALGAKARGLALEVLAALAPVWRYFCKIVGSTAEGRGQTVAKTLGGFVFQNAMAPLFEAPFEFGLFPGRPDSHTTKVLAYLSAFVEELLTETQPSRGILFAHPIKRVIIDAREAVTAALLEVAAVPDDAPPPAARSLECGLSATAKQNSLRQLASHLGSLRHLIAKSPDGCVPEAIAAFDRLFQHIPRSLFASDDPAVVVPLRPKGSQTLLLPPSATMTPATARRIQRRGEQGAEASGAQDDLPVATGPPRPSARASMADYMQSTGGVVGAAVASAAGAAAAGSSGASAGGAQAGPANDGPPSPAPRPGGAGSASPAPRPGGASPGSANPSSTPAPAAAAAGAGGGTGAGAGGSALPAPPTEWSIMGAVRTYIDCVPAVLPAVNSAIRGSTQSAEYAENLLIVAHAYGECLPVIEEAVAIEVATAADPSSMFRGLNVSSKLLTRYLESIAHPYLRGCLEPAVREIMASDAVSFEIDKDKVPKNQKRKNNLAFLETTADRLVTQLASSLTQVPQPLRFLLSRVRAISDAKWLGQGVGIVSSLFFARVVVGSLCSPATLGIDAAAVNIGHLRSLSVLGRVIQAIASGVPFEKKDPMSTLNKFVAQRTNSLGEFILQMTVWLTNMTSVTPVAVAPDIADQASDVIIERLVAVREPFLAALGTPPPAPAPGAVPLSAAAAKAEAAREAKRAIALQRLLPASSEDEEPPPPPPPM